MPYLYNLNTIYRNTMIIVNNLSIKLCNIKKDTTVPNIVKCVDIFWVIQYIYMQGYTEYSTKRFNLLIFYYSFLVQLSFSNLILNKTKMYYENCNLLCRYKQIDSKMKKTVLPLSHYSFFLYWRLQWCSFVTVLLFSLNTHCFMITFFIDL